MVMGVLTVCLCPRPHVCAEQELTLVGRRQPCVRAFSRTVPVWRPGCGRQAWCVSHERRYVQRSQGPVWGWGLSSLPLLHGVQGGDSVAGMGLSWSQGIAPPRSAPHLRSRPLTLPWGMATMEAIPRLYTPAQRPPGAWWVGADPVVRGPVRRRRRGPCRERCWLSMQEGESGVLSLLRSHLPAASPCETSIAQDFISKSSGGSAFACLSSSGRFWNLPDCRAGWGGVRRAFHPSLF